ncbi:KTSC domain-containing protein [Tardiphaga sp. 71_E8_N1_1]|uniref:KTSC domain-containing protein n=1 Tax=Tardiphaga sp. 71_E8_N1_1 TaxID=3240784 RepID=UPI003F889FDF
MTKLIFALALSVWSIGVQAETVDVKYRGDVNLTPFRCTDTPRSSFVERVCYDRLNEYMIIRLKSVYYHYCEMPEAAFNAFLAASSMGQYFNANIKGTGKDGPFDCRTHRAPNY